MCAKNILSDEENPANDLGSEKAKGIDEKSFKTRFYSFLYSRKGVNTIFWIAAAGHIIMALIFPDNSDYLSYIHDWTWYPLGFYLFFNEFYLIWYHLPKLIFMCCFLVADYQLLRKLFYTGKEYEQISEKMRFWAVMYILLSPIFAYVNWGGLFDSLIGLIILNFILLFENIRMNIIIRNLLALVLIVACVLIKYVGVVLIVPFFLGDYILRRSNPYQQLLEKRIRTNLLFIICIVLIAVVGIIFYSIFFSPVQFDLLISPFFKSAERLYTTTYDVLLLNNEPISLIVFTDIFSALGVYIFLVSLLITYFLCYKKKASLNAWITLSVFDFLTFFQISHIQFILWVVFPFTLYYLKKTPNDEHLTRKYALLQCIGLLINFHLPFIQFLYLYFIVDIFRIESNHS
ncbi:MAG TPA: hypothetical protein VKM55_18775 [Candidatus Lokiarchaeia archaeon]|nr:hypothetical protein [Candidatus Lokiarchaeia archaeon]